jgi:hypothetical protein
VRFEVLTTVTIKTMWDVMQKGNSVLEEPAASAFRVEGIVADSSKTLVIMYRIIAHYIPEDNNVHLTLSLNTSVTTVMLVQPASVCILMAYCHE